MAKTTNVKIRKGWEMQCCKLADFTDNGTEAEGGIETTEDPHQPFPLFCTIKERLE